MFQRRIKNWAKIKVRLVMAKANFKVKAKVKANVDTKVKAKVKAKVRNLRKIKEQVQGSY